MKKRILSLILALSMVLSVLPLGAFAAPLPELVMENGRPTCSNGTIGNGWGYMNGTLILTSEEYDFRYINPKTKTGGYANQAVQCAIVIESYAKITGGTFEEKVTNNAGTIYGGIFNAMVENKVAQGALGKIAGGAFNKTVTNNGTISGGAFDGTVTNKGIITAGAFYQKVDNYSGGTISGGTFSTTVTNYSGGTISSGTFSSTVENSSGTISDGTFNGDVANRGTIKNGTFAADKEVTNSKTIENGTFNGTVRNHNGTISGGKFEGTVINNVSGKISDGTFNKEVSNIMGEISDGTFNATVTNHGEGKISGGTFKGTVTNKGNIMNGTFKGRVINDQGNIKGNINGGTFAAGLSKNSGHIYHGVFNGNTALTTKVHHVTVTNGSVLKVNDEAPLKVDETTGAVTTGTAWDLYVYAGTTVTITASTEIFSLNGKSIGGGIYNSSQDSNDKKTVTFTMPNENVELNKTTNSGDLVMKDGLPDCPDGTKGNGWEYRNGKLTLTRNSGTFDFSSTHPQGKTPGTPTTTPVACAIEISSGVEITGGTFAGSVTNWSTISGGTFQNTCSVTNNGTIKDNGIFEGEVTNYTSGRIFGGTFNETVTNSGNIKDGTFNGKVTNSNTIENGTFNGTVENYSTINGNGTFNGEVTNHGYIKDGTFAGKVTNNDGTIYGGTFAGSVENKWKIYGGVFNGKTGLDGVTDLHSITVASGAKITEINGVPAAGVSAVWDPYVVIESGKTKEVTIKANTEIFSLNGKPIGDGNCKSSYGSDKTTVKFTMPNGPVVLNGAITCTDLVMEGGWPEDSNNGTDKGTISCSGNGWSYDSSTKTLTLTDGEYDFSSTEPVKCEILLDSENAKITGGTFEADVKNNDGGTISDGTFNGTVENNGGKISSGTFKGTVQHWYGTISGGTFHEKVLNSHGAITGGTFAAGLSGNNGAVTGGVFNGNTGLNGVTGLHSIKWDDDYSKANTNAKIEKVNGVSAEWNPYVVVTELTTATAKEVTITANTDIYSLNGQLLGADDRVNGDKKTVKFTMPDDMPDNENVVLNKAITSTDLVMENGWPKDSNGGTIPCKGDGWQYIPNDPNFGNMLLLTGSNQTGGLYDFSIIGDGSAVECNVFVGKPTAITGGEFNGKVFNNSGILGGTFNGPVENMGPGTINDGTFKNSVKNNGMIENGTFHDEVENNGTINDGAFNGKVENNSVINSGTFHGEVVNTTMGRIEDGMFNDAVENNGTIEKGTFHDAVKNNSTINSGTFNGAVENNGIINGGTFNGAVTDNGTISGNITGSGTLNGEPITKTPEPEPEPEPTTYTVTVIGGTIDGKTSVSAKENDTLTVVLDQNDIPDGMTFDLWSISSSKLSGDINVDYRAEAMTFQMPAEDVTIRAQYRSAEIIEDAAPSPLATAATIAVGGAAAGIVVWQGVNLGVDLYLANALPQGVPVPTDRRALALLLWETAGKPEVALPTLYGDIPAEEIELQKATHWAVQNGLMDAADKKDASFFDPDHYVTKMDVFGAWLRLKKLLGTIGTSPTQ